jgi:glycosyltransferase involved in cell wall biosynthesis
MLARFQDRGPMSLDKSARFVITLPVFRDTQYLESAVKALEEATASFAMNFVILIAEDGSDSSSVVNELKSKYQNLIHVQHSERLGRGRALREAWSEIEGDVFAYVDVDLATDLNLFNAYQNLLQNQSKFDLVTGSRYVHGAVTNRPWLREFSSKAYNQFVRVLFATGVHDHQCGFKSFSKNLVETLIREARSDTWFWDTEVIVLAKKLGFAILEIPIHWTEKRARKTPIRRLSRDIWIHGSGLIKLFWRVYFEPT